MIQYTNLDGVAMETIEGADIRSLCYVSVPEGSVAIVKGSIMAVRFSDGAAKAWTFESLLRCPVGQSAAILETIPSPPNLFATAADETALAGVTITFGARPGEAGVECTTPAGMTIAWYARLVGAYIKDQP